MARARSFGNVRKLPSGRYQAATGISGSRSRPIRRRGRPVERWSRRRSHRGWLGARPRPRRAMGRLLEAPERTGAQRLVEDLDGHPTVVVRVGGRVSSPWCSANEASGKGSSQWMGWRRPVGPGLTSFPWPPR
jgi:hypothetical protein